MPLVVAAAIRLAFSDIAIESMPGKCVFQSMWVSLNMARLPVVLSMATVCVPSAEMASLMYSFWVSKVCVGVISCCALALEMVIVVNVVEASRAIRMMRIVRPLCNMCVLVGAGLRVKCFQKKKAFFPFSLLLSGYEV